MAGANWLSTITIVVILSTSPPSRQGFGTAMFLVDQDAGNGLNGARSMSFASYTEAAAANTAGYISAGTLEALRVGFSQQPTPATIKVGYHDTGAAETIAAAITAIRAFDDDWYGLAIYSRADADIVAAANAIEAISDSPKFFVAQSDDASLLDAGMPAGLTTLTGKERTALLYHSSDAQYGDLAWLVSRLVWDPDSKSAPWEGQIREVAAITAITSAQRDFIVTNKANVGLPFSSATVYVSPGQNMNGRAIYEIVSGDWLKARFSEDIAYEKLKHTDRGEKIIVDSTGQAKILGILNLWLQQGEAVGHFVRGETRVTGETITSADILARRMRFKVEAMIAADARLFNVTIYLQPTELQEAA
jgi:hypothetical protein